MSQTHSFGSLEFNLRLGESVFLRCIASRVAKD